MTLVSPQDDFVQHTLASMPGLLARLDYIAGLRTSTGSYRHWGLEQVYGQAAVNKAIARAHTDVWVEVLRAPLPVLFQELLQDQRRSTSPSGYIQDMAARVDQIVPGGMGGGSLRHFNSILSTLLALCRGQQGTSQRVA